MAGNRGRGRGLFAAVTLLLGTAQAGTAAAPAVHIDDPVYAAPQRLVTVAPGRRLNLYCVGHGSPTVVLEAGLGDSTIGWALVRKPIARATRVCSYDRAGLGFSDGSGEPGDAVHIAADLHALLQAAGERPPYVLVGHSAGGLYTRM